MGEERARYVIVTTTMSSRSFRPRVARARRRRRRRCPCVRSSSRTRRDVAPSVGRRPRSVARAGGNDVGGVRDQKLLLKDFISCKLVKDFISWDSIFIVVACVFVDLKKIIPAPARLAFAPRLFGQQARFPSEGKVKASVLPHHLSALVQGARFFQFL